MTTTTEKTAANGEPMAALDETATAAGDPVASVADVQAEPVLGGITVQTHDGARCVTWTCGTTAVWHGLTLTGIAAAARATADFIDGLSDAEQAALAKSPGRTQVRIAVHEWSVPLLPHLAGVIEELMIGVINAEGSIGRVA